MKKKYSPFFLIVLLSCIFCTQVWAQYPTVKGNVLFDFTLTDNTWYSGLTYDVYVRVGANDQQYSSWVLFYQDLTMPGTYTDFDVQVNDIPYPSPINPYTYKIHILAVRSDDRPFTGWQYATETDYPPDFELTANNTIQVQ
jgi:hypothetical protein